MFKATHQNYDLEAYAIDCLTTKEWRMNNLYVITDKNGDKVFFNRNVVQQKIAKSPAKRKMILKARQFGVSTNEIVDMFDDVCFNKNMTCCILAHEQDSIKKLFNIVRKLYKFMPPEVQPRLDRGGGSKYEMYFPDLNSRIYCDLESRGDTIHRLHVSEMAFMKDSSKLKSTLQAVPLGGRVTIETTPNGMANHFYDMWVDKEQPYAKLFFPWYVFPEYKLPCEENIVLADEEKELVKKAKKLYNITITKEQIAFRRFKKAELKSSGNDVVRVTFEQEYPEDDKTCFLTSGEAVMDLFVVNDIITKSKPPISRDKGFTIYKKPVKGRRYVCGADPAEGINSDFSSAILLDNDTLETVATIRGQWKPSDFASKLDELCRMYSSPGGVFPLLGVERNNHGHAVLLKLNEVLNYPNLYVHESDERLGWKSDAITRPIMINAFIDAVEDGHLKTSDQELLNECLTLVDNNGKIEAATGKHDDMIVACAIAIQLAITKKSNSLDNIEDRLRV